MIAALKSKGVSAIGAAGFCWGGKWFAFNSTLTRNLMLEIFENGFCMVNVSALSANISRLLAYFSGMVLVKLASSTDLHAAVILHPGPITEDQINGKYPISHTHAKFLIQTAWCLRC